MFVDFDVNKLVEEKLKEPSTTEGGPVTQRADSDPCTREDGGAGPQDLESGQTTAMGGPGFDEEGGGTLV